MYKNKLGDKTTLKVNQGYLGETIEAKVRRIVNNKEPIKDGAPLIYTDREDGVPPETNVRTDKWDIAIEATEAAAGQHLSDRELRIGERTYDTMSAEEQKAFNTRFPKNKHAGKGKDTKGESTHTTDNQ